MKEIVEEIIKNLVVVKPVIKNDMLSEESNINSLGINSLEFMDLLMVLEKKYSIEFTEKNILINTYGTIRDLALYIEKQISLLKSAM